MGKLYVLTTVIKHMKITSICMLNMQWGQEQLQIHLGLFSQV